MENYAKMICEVCGGIDFTEKNGKLICKHCDTTYEKKIVNETEEDQRSRTLKWTRHDDAEKELRLDPPNFDVAEDKFSDLIAQYPEWSVGYWGAVRAKYGIKYKVDYDGKSIPICYKSSYTDFREDSYFKKAVQFAETEELKNKYITEANKIAATCKEWRESAAKYSYDIFISFKATDENIETVDSREMQNLYAFLTGKGYKVFFSPVSGKEFVGNNYDAFIFNALEKSRVMILYGSNAEYFNSPWVSSEWMRYLRMISRGEKEKDSLIPCYVGLDPNELPRLIRSIQGINFAEKSCYVTILERVSAILGRKSKDKAKLESVVIEGGKVGKKNKVIQNKVQTIEIGSKHIARKAKLPQGQINIREVASGAIGIYTPSELKTLEMGEVALSQNSCAEAEMFFKECLSGDGTYGKAWIGLICAKTRQPMLYKLIVQHQVLGWNNISSEHSESCVIEIKNAIEFADDKETAEKVLEYVTIVLRKRIEQEIFDGSFISLSEIVFQYNTVFAGNLMTAIDEALPDIHNTAAVDIFRGIVEMRLKRINDVDDYCEFIEKLIGIYSRKNDIASIKEWNNKLLEIDSDNAEYVLRSICLLLDTVSQNTFLELATKPQNAQKVITKAKVLLPNLSAETATKLLNLMSSAGKKCGNASTHNLSSLKLYFDFLIRYDFEERNEFIISLAKSFPDFAKEKHLDLFEGVLNVYPSDDVDWHINKRNEFADCLRGYGYFASAIKIYQTVFELQEGNEKALKGILLSKIRSTGMDSEKLNWKGFNIADWEKLLAACLVEIQDNVITEWCGKCLKYVANLSSIHTPAKAKYKPCLDVFATLIKYYSKDSEVKLYKQVSRMAEICLHAGIFKEAKLYYSLLLNDKNTVEHIARWGILLADFRCRSEEELMLCAKFDIECDDYKMLKLSCGTNTKAFKKYSDIAAKNTANKKSGLQQLRREYQRGARNDWAAKNIVRLNLHKFILMFSMCALAAIGVLFGIIAWIVLGKRFVYRPLWVVIPFAVSVIVAIIALVAFAKYKFLDESESVAIKKQSRLAWYIFKFCILYAVFFGGGIVCFYFMAEIANEATIPFFLGGLVCWTIGIVLAVVNHRTKGKYALDWTAVSAAKRENPGIFRIRLRSILVLILSIVLLIPSSIVAGIGNEYDGYGENYYYEVLSDDTISLKRYTGDISADQIVIPEAIDGKKVTVLGSELFEGYKLLTKVEMPDGVKRIEWRTFYGCTALSSVNIPNSVTDIGATAFYGCRSLTSVTIPNGVTTIGSSAFEGCSSLIGVAIPNSVTSIGAQAFYECAAMRKVTVGEGVTEIGDQAFAYCSQLEELQYNAKNCKDFSAFEKGGNGVFYQAGTSASGIKVTFGKAVERVPARLFRGKYSTSSTVYSGSPNLYSVAFEVGSVCKSIGEDAFRDTKINSIVLPNSLEMIEDMAFQNCSNLTSIIIPMNVTTIGFCVFRGCSRMTIYCRRSEPASGFSAAWNSNEGGYTHGTINTVWGYSG